MYEWCHKIYDCGHFVTMETVTNFIAQNVIFPKLRGQS